MPKPNMDNTESVKTDKTVIYKINKKPNGGKETTYTTYTFTNGGNERRVVRKERGKKSYELVTTRDKNGATTSTEEILTNLEEAEVSKFKRSFEEKPKNKKKKKCCGCFCFGQKKDKDADED